MGVSEKALITGADISNYIPQRRPMVMVDAFYGIDEGGVSHSGFTVSGDNVFCRDGILDECALMENLAQSAALRVGWQHVSQGKAVPLGFIGAIDRCAITGRARVGEQLHTTVETVAQIGGVTLVEAKVAVRSEVRAEEEEAICSARLKIYLE